MIFKTGLLNHEYKFTYVFTNKTYEVVSGVKISLSPRNNSLCGYGWNNQDGLVPEVFAKPGEHIKTLIKPEKIVFTSTPHLTQRTINSLPTIIEPNPSTKGANLQLQRRQPRHGAIWDDNNMAGAPR